MRQETVVSPETLARIVEACDRLLADDDWFADRPYHWRTEVERLRGELAEQLDQLHDDEASYY